MTVILPKRDPGLQPERTGLAWSRTAFVMFLTCMICLRVYLSTGHPSSLVESLLSGGMTVKMVLCARQRMRYNPQSEDLTKPTNMHSRTLIFQVFAVVFAIAVLEVINLLFLRQNSLNILRVLW